MVTKYKEHAKNIQDSLGKAGIKVTQKEIIKSFKKNLREIKKTGTLKWDEYEYRGN